MKLDRRADVSQTTMKKLPSCSVCVLRFFRLFLFGFASRAYTPNEPVEKRKRWKLSYSKTFFVAKVAHFFVDGECFDDLRAVRCPRPRDTNHGLLDDRSTVRCCLWTPVTVTRVTVDCRSSHVAAQLRKVKRILSISWLFKEWILRLFRTLWQLVGHFLTLGTTRNWKEVQEIECWRFWCPISFDG